MNRSVIGIVCAALFIATATCAGHEFDTNNPGMGYAMASVALIFLVDYIANTLRGRHL